MKIRQGLGSSRKHNRNQAWGQTHRFNKWFSGCSLITIPRNMLHAIVSGCQLPSNDHLQQFFKSEWERKREGESSRWCLCYIWQSSKHCLWCLALTYKSRVRKYQWKCINTETQYKVKSSLLLVRILPMSGNQSTKYEQGPLSSLQS
jgi:hypothetical protein